MCHLRPAQKDLSKLPYSISRELQHAAQRKNMQKLDMPQNLDKPENQRMSRNAEIAEIVPLSDPPEDSKSERQHAERRLSGTISARF